MCAEKSLRRCGKRGFGVQFRRMPPGGTGGSREPPTLDEFNDNHPEGHANLLILEIGNSHVSVATTIGGRVRTNIRFELDRLDEAVATAVDSWAALPEEHLRSVAIGSVVGPVLERILAGLSGEIDEPLRVVGRELHRPLSMAVEQPESVGIDRVCAAAAAHEAFDAACVVASFGTAITVDCVNGEGVFMGGAILPGLGLQSRSLHEGAEALPLVEPASTDVVFGATTEQAIRNGIIYGAVGAVREIAERYATELGAWPKLVVTGGTAELVSRHCDFVDSVVPDLCIRGIALAHRRHFVPLDTP